MKTFQLTLLLLLSFLGSYAQTTVYGCMDAQALNYNPLATEDGGNCCYTYFLSSDAQEEHVYFISFYSTGLYAFIYPGLGGETGLCVPEGCIQMQVYPGGLGYADLTFYLNGETLTTFTAEELESTSGIVSVSVGSSLAGCIDQWACNYNPQANCNDGSCTYDCLGCTDPNSYNYNPAATIDNGSCCDAENYITVTADVPDQSLLEFEIFNNPGGFYFFSFYGTSLCIPDGCYEMTASYFGSGLIDNQIPITVTNANGDVLLSSNFDNFSQNSIPISIDAVAGCADFYACNYNPQATCFTNCVYDCFGCTDPTADNYSPQATVDNGSCCYGQIQIVSNSDVPFSWYLESQTDFIWGNYPELSTACISEGCMNITIYPYSELPVNQLEWSIIDENGNILITEYTSGLGGTYSFALNAIEGCTDPNACNFNPNANCAQYELCTYDCFGCTDPSAPNYNASALIDDGSCCTNNWYTLESDVAGYWYAYVNNGTSTAGGDLSIINGFCASEGCIYITFYPYDYNDVDFDLTAYLNGEVVASSAYDPLIGGISIEIANGAIYGCMDQYACNFDPQATCADYELCSYGCYGCTDESALNYSIDATIDNGSCCFNSWYTVEMSSPAYWYTTSLVDYNYGYGQYPEQNGFCVDGECFQFYAWSIDGTPLTYAIYDDNGNVVSSGEVDANYGNVITVTAGDYIVGCGDLYACNYNPNATCFDYYSCDYSCYGCTDEDAPNYDPSATLDNGSCCSADWYNVTMNGAAYWYSYDANYITSGGIYPDANGFCNSSTCASFIVYSFTDQPVEYSITDVQGNVVFSGIAYPGSYNIESISFGTEIAGCTEPTACNYNPEATCESGSCDYYCGGCLDESAMNYDAEAVYDDGTCFYSAVPPQMGMALLEDEENQVYYVVMNITDLGNGSPYLMSANNGIQMMMNEAGEYVAGPFACDAEIDFTLQSLAMGMATYMNATTQGQCAIISSTEEVVTTGGGLLIYPNPNNGQFTISGISEPAATLRIFDLSGRMVREQLVNGGNQININTEELTNGVYQVSVVTANNIITERMVVKK
jgi:hypothetical protein